MGKNRVQRKQKEKDKPKQKNIYSKKHIRITQMKQMKQPKRKPIIKSTDQVYGIYH